MLSAGMTPPSAFLDTPTPLHLKDTIISSKYVLFGFFFSYKTNFLKNHTAPSAWTLLPPETISKTRQICHCAASRKRKTARGQEKTSLELQTMLPLLQLSNVEKTQDCPKFCTSSTSRNAFWQQRGLQENMRNRFAQILWSGSFTLRNIRWHLIETASETYLDRSHQFQIQRMGVAENWLLLQPHSRFVLEQSHKGI